MKAPSMNVSASLRSQRQLPANGPAVIETSGLVGGKGSGIFPGERGVEAPPGTPAPRSAVHHGEAVGRMAGK